MFSHLIEYISKKPVLETDMWRPEFERQSAGASPDPKWREKAERYVLANTPGRHRYVTAEGQEAIVYFDARGRAACAAISEVPDQDLARIADMFSGRAPGADPVKPSGDTGYVKPAMEEKLKTVEPGHYFVLVDVSVAGGKLASKKLFRGAASADSAVAKMPKGKVQVIDAAWYVPAEELLRAAGMQSASMANAK